MAYIVSLKLRNCVVLLHGLARTPGSMKPMGSALADSGYHVVNLGYPSRKKKIEELAALAVNTGVQGCPPDAPQVHFVTHSLGGILVRYFLEKNEIPRFGRVVMIAPPNQGSQVVDNLRNIPGYKIFNGPAGLQLGTDENSIPKTLGPVGFPLGVIAGTRTFNPILSLGLPNPDDGKVSVENTKIEGMIDFIEVPHTHTFIMRAEIVIEQVKYFLKNGSFGRDAA
jgi:triacylglycerol lipase